MKKTLYDILRVDNNASSERIDAAYLTQKKILQNAADQESQNDLKLVQHAYLVLSDRGQRDKYDQSLKRQIARDNSLIYYSDAYTDRSWPTRFLFLIAIAAAVFFAFQHVNKSNAGTPYSLVPHDSNTPTATAATPATYVEPAVVIQTSESAPQQPLVSGNIENRAAGGDVEIDDVDAVPFIDGVGRQHYREFLAHSSPRAFVICQNGSFSTIFGSNQFVTQQLQSRPGGCEPYVVNDEVVWKK
ncbi:J domain-containing protein [Sideroxydans lithotrophicus]|uniref:Heat shock protein DnaJ domain protein n=1 Tax=Sideroxydans lithotrophicus (strain ES-1) TaxID=580332 RepID=D5CPH1_SIDLE|nr:DnaJ domain-containing protein [Sideroxydans lithotrophicus]ADE11112.1 heat shock protein DnaJ domain protein [Sideroxydans lithotrophicus ES-1]